MTRLSWTALRDNCFCKAMTVSQAFIFHFKCYIILHFAVCQLLCWAFLSIIMWTNKEVWNRRKSCTQPTQDQCLNTRRHKFHDYIHRLAETRDTVDIFRHNLLTLCDYLSSMFRSSLALTYWCRVQDQYNCDCQCLSVRCLMCWCVGRCRQCMV